MKTNHFIKLAALLLICCTTLGCGKEDNPSGGGSDSGTGSIYGCVTDFATGEPVRNANVQLRPSGETTLTGSDGNYEFLDVPCGTYSIKVTKEGYSDLIDDYDIVVENSKQTKRDVQIRKLPSSLHIYDNESNEISELDFGTDEGVTQKTFNIFNGGSQSLQYVITVQANWISISQTQLTGTIGVGVTFPIIVTINRELLVDGNNSTTLLITSSADGGKELTVKARKSSAGDGVYELFSAGLMVQTEDLGSVDWSSAKLLCENSTVAGFSDWRLPTKEELMTLYANRELIGGFANGKYWSSSTGYSSNKYYVDFIDGTSDQTSYTNEHYHVRAVRTITNENSVVELPSANLMVQTQDLGCVDWTSAKLMCESSIVANYSDWRLPTKEELMVLYNNKETIGGFYGDWYWSSGYAGHNYDYDDLYYCVNFNSGSIGSKVYYDNWHVRAVRTINGGVSVTKPTVITNISPTVASNSAICGGNVTSDGGADVIQRGIRYSTSANSVTSGQMVPCSTSGIGNFTCSLMGLSTSTKYYFCAYAINSEGTACGSVESFTTENGGGSGGQTYSYTFESTWEGWTTIDADGDGNTWLRFYSDEGNIGHNNSVYLMGSESYINDFGPLTPDNYLVSPQRYTMSSGSKISFYVCAQDAGWSAEHYGVAVATTSSNPTASDFVTIWEETLTAKARTRGKARGTNEQGTWYLKTVDLSAYAGQSIWIAIRHFNCTDQFMINVDDITISTGN